MEENTSLESQKYADVSLSEAEQQMQKYLEESYGLTRDEFVSIVLWLDNFSLRFDSIERFEQVEDALSKDFALNSNDIFGILFSHGDVFCNDYSKTQADFEFLKQRYSYSKKDFADMLKAGCVIDKSQIRELEQRLKERFPGKKWIPMPKILKNVIEYANVDYASDIAYKIDLLDKFGVPFDDLNGKFEFLKLPIQDLTTRLKLMNLTNELPHSFLNVGYKTPNTRVYKLFLKFQADNALKKKGYNSEYVSLKKLADSIDESQPLTEEQLKDIDSKFAVKFKNIHNAISSLKMPETKMAIPVEVQVESAVEPVESETSVVKVEKQTKKEETFDAVESGKMISYMKSSGPQVKKSQQSDVRGSYEFVQIDPAHKYIWTYMVKNFGLSYQEYPEVARSVDPSKKNRLQQQATDIEAVFADVEKDFHISRRDFGQFFKYTLYGMEQRLALLECFGITVQDLADNDYVNAQILGLNYDQLEYMLKVASVGKVDLEKNLGRMSKFNKDTFLAKYIKFAETGEGKNMLDTPLSEREYQDIIYQKVPYYKKNKIVENRYAEMFPVSNSFLEGYNESQRNLLMIVGFLIKKYGMSYQEAKSLVENSRENFNMHTKVIQSRLSQLEELGYDSLNVIHNSGILRLPEEKAIPRAIMAKYLKMDEETFLKHYISTSEAKVFARMMGAIDIKPSYYYASEKVFNGLTGLSTEDLISKHSISNNSMYKLKKKIYDAEKMKQVESILERSIETPVLNEEGKLTAYAPQETEFRNYMTEKYGIDAFAFHTARYILGSKGLSFLTKEQAIQAIEILKDSFKMSDENISELFVKNPRAFSTGFDKFISQYNYFEDNFDTSRHMYRKLLLKGDESMILRDGLAETYKDLADKVKTDFGVNIGKNDFVNILRNLKGDETFNIGSYVHNALVLLENYGINPEEIKMRYDSCQRMV